MPRHETRPRVSVIIPHYGGEKILRECINSLNNSGFSDLEIIVVDNNSNDDSAKIIKKLRYWDVCCEAHAESTWPRSKEVLNSVLKSVSKEDQRKIVCENVARIFNFA